MYEVFTKLLNMSLTASIPVLFIILLRFVLKKAPRKYICIMWAIVALRLICPISISSTFSAYNMLHQNTVSTGQVEYFEYNGKTEKPELTFEVPALVNSNYSPDSMTIGTKTSGVYMPTVVYIWMAGMFVMFAYATVSNYYLRREVKASIKKKDNLYVCDEIKSPFILGIICPRIYLPSGISEEVKENVIAHEKAHIKRLDHFWKPLGFLLLSVYWFNPLMWVAYIFLCKDIEAACDEKVISKMNKEDIASYSEALLSCAFQRRMITACPIAFGETDVKGRIRNVLNYKKPAFWIIFISLFACIVVAVCFLTNPQKKEIVYGTYVKTDVTDDPMLYWSGLTINEDGTFSFSPSMISSYIGTGTWETEGDYVIFSDIGMGDVRKEFFRYFDGNLYYVKDMSAANSMWGLADETEYVLNTDYSYKDMFTKAPEGQQSASDSKENAEIENVDSSVIELVSKYADEQVKKLKEQGRWKFQTDIGEITNNSAKIRYYVDRYETNVILWVETIQYECDGESIDVTSSDWRYYHNIAYCNEFLEAYSGDLEGTGMDYSKNGKGEQIKEAYSFKNPFYSVRRLLNLADDYKYIKLSLETNGDDTCVLISFIQNRKSVTVKMIQPWEDSEVWIPWQIYE